MQPEIVVATRLSERALTELWNEAFANYYVPMQLNVERFSLLVRRELISLPDSFVAVVNDQPVGFALAGLRGQGDQLRGYDAGTAVVPAYRRQGIGRLLMQALVEQLRDRGVGRITLTAVTANTKAVELYRSLGFTDYRQLTCWERTDCRGHWSSRPEGLRLELVQPSEVLALQPACYRQAPEWQNWPEGEKWEGASALLAKWNGLPVAYALFAGRSPLYLYQLGVLPAWRRRGYGRAILQTLLATTGLNSRLIYLNHPEEEAEATAWLGATGFSTFLSQLEMQLVLRQ